MSARPITLLLDTGVLVTNIEPVQPDCLCIRLPHNYDCPEAAVEPVQGWEERLFLLSPEQLRLALAHVRTVEPDLYDEALAHLEQR